MVNMLSGRIRYKRPCNAGFHEYDVSRRGKSTETEGGWWWQGLGEGRVGETAEGYEVSPLGG